MPNKFLSTSRPETSKNIYAIAYIPLVDNLAPGADNTV
jgi:hypothetical protein